MRWCSFCDLKGKMPCGAVEFSTSRNPCSREHGHAESHIFCWDELERHVHRTWEQTSHDKDNEIARYRVGLETVLSVLDPEADKAACEIIDDLLGREPSDRDAEAQALGREGDRYEAEREREVKP